MGFQAKRELLLQTGARYSQAEGQGKTTILDEFVLATGYDRKYAIRLLNNPAIPPAAAISRTRAHKYGSSSREALEVAWKAANCICTKRLIPFLPELIPLLEHHGHLVLSQETRFLLLSVSAATADRLLFTSRRAATAGGLSTTKPGRLLKRQIPLRTFSEWADTKIGFFEADLVAHCGTSVAGTFIWTLVMTDVASGWTECFAMAQRSGSGVVFAIRQIQRVLPFPILGIDTDNGSEFINEDLMEFCRTEKITFTRGRVHRKNDQCFVEQKNGSIVRQIVGYDRYDGQLALRQLSELYRALRLYVNFYQPSMKLKKKTRDGASVHKTYSPAQTPLQRLFAGNVLSQARQEQLEILRKSIDPVSLLRLMQTLQDAFWRYATVATQNGTEPGFEAQPVIFKLEACLPGADSQLPVESKAHPRKYRRASKPRKPRTYLTRRDPFEAVDADLYELFLASPQTTAKELLRKLQSSGTNPYPDKLLRTLQRKISRWRRSVLIEFASPWGDNGEIPSVRGVFIPETG